MGLIATLCLILLIVLSYTAGYTHKEKELHRLKRELIRKYREDAVKEVDIPEFLK